MYQSSTDSVFEKTFKYALIAQPFTILDCNYRPDFYCPETGSIYEVTTNGAANHISRGHLSCAARIAPVYIVEVYKEKVVSINKYRPTKPGIKPTEVHISEKALVPLITGIARFHTIEGNRNLAKLVQTSRRNVI